MFRRIFGKKKQQLPPPPEQAPPVTAPVESKDEFKVIFKEAEVKEVEEQTVEAIKDETEKVADVVEEAIQDGKFKIWIMGNICCCLKGQEAAKVGAVTDVHVEIY